MTRFTRQSVCVYVLTALMGQANGITGGFTPAEDDRRFDAVCALIAWSHWQGNCAGHPQCQPGGAFACDGTELPWDACPDCATCNFVRCSGTLVAPNLVLLVGHCPHSGPGSNWGFRFRRKPDGLVGQVDQSEPDHGASSFHHVRVECFIEAFPELGDGPMLAVLEEPVTHIDPIPVRFALPEDLPVGSQILISGWGFQTPEPWSPGESCPIEEPSHRAKVAAQVVSGFIDWILLWPSPCISQPDPLAQGQVFPRDSGGPVLVPVQGCAGRHEVVAMHWAIGGAFLIAQVLNDENTSPDFLIPAPCDADLDNSRIVDGLDLGILLANWSIPPETSGCGGAVPCRADINCDGLVNGLDLGILLASWGECPGPYPTCGGAAMAAGGGGEASSAPSSPSTATPDWSSLIEWISQASYTELMEWYLSGMPLPGEPQQ